MKALVLHGFTGALATVSPLADALKAHGFEVSTPILRGHSTDPGHLFRVHWRDWVSDAREAYRELDSRTPGPLYLAGLSMGGLVAAVLAAEFPKETKRLALVAPAFGFRSKLVHIAPLIKQLRKTWPSEPDYADPKLAENSTNYDRFPVEAMQSLLGFVPVVDALLPHIQCPVGIFTAKKDPIVAKGVAKTLEKKLKKNQTTLFSYKKSHHEMLTDVEGEQVTRDIVDFLLDSKLRL